jgi:hypothetical protein
VNILRRRFATTVTRVVAEGCFDGIMPAPTHQLPGVEFAHGPMFDPLSLSGTGGWY